MTTAALTSLTERVSPIAAGAHVVACAWLGREPVLALADGTALIAGIGEEKRVTPHADAGLLVAAARRDALLTGGDDGRVVRMTADGSIEEIGAVAGRWIDAVAASPSGAVAWAAGKAVFARDDKGKVSRWDAPTTARGLAFAPKGYRVAISHYNGVSSGSRTLRRRPNSSSGRAAIST